MNTNTVHKYAIMITKLVSNDSLLNNKHLPNYKHMFNSLLNDCRYEINPCC